MVAITIKLTFWLLKHWFKAPKEGRKTLGKVRKETQMFEITYHTKPAFVKPNSI